MGRKRVKVNVGHHAPTGGSVPLNLKDIDGLYPFSKSWSWRPLRGKDKNTDVLICIDRNIDTNRTDLQINKIGDPDRYFYTAFHHLYPRVVEALAISIKTLSIDTRPCHPEISYSRVAIGRFLRFCLENKIKLDKPEDINFALMCRWREHMREVEQQSRYKAIIFRRFCRVLQVLMGSHLIPKRFTVPTYTSDKPEALPPYSDAVMYQLICACISDIDQIMRHAKCFNELAKKCTYEDKNPTKTNERWKKLLSYYQEHCSIRNTGTLENLSPGHTSKKKFISMTSNLFNYYPDERISYEENVPLVTYNLNRKNNSPLRALIEREVPTVASLLPFLLLFMISTGTNRETILSWRRKYLIGGKPLSTLECRDPLDNSKCRIRGSKRRVGRSGHEKPYDSYIHIAEFGLYPILEFIIWYTEPLTPHAENSQENSLWLVFTSGKVNNYESMSLSALNSPISHFLDRHEIWDLVPDKNGTMKKARLTCIDTRRFRKVYTAKELLKAVAECNNHQELASQLSHALRHNSFDTTLGSYLSHDASMITADIAIFTLQEKYIEDALKFRGTRHADEPIKGRPAFMATCSDPTSPDFESSSPTKGIDCSEYDMCLGCSKSNVFDEHLPRIAKRILQYEEKRKTMTESAWSAEYGRKHARAQDLLKGWPNKDSVDKAWAAANCGKVILPEIIISSNGALNE